MKEIDITAKVNRWRAKGGQIAKITVDPRVNQLN
jgi:hypothetical protein